MTRGRAWERRRHGISRWRPGAVRRCSHSGQVSRAHWWRRKTRSRLASDASSSDWAQGYPDVETTAITRLTIQQILREGIARTAGTHRRSGCQERKPDRAWLHAGSRRARRTRDERCGFAWRTGLRFQPSSRHLLRAVIASAPALRGMTVCIYDPDLDQGCRFARPMRWVGSRIALRS